MSELYKKTSSTEGIQNTKIRDSRSTYGTAKA